MSNRIDHLSVCLICAVSEELRGGGDAGGQVSAQVRGRGGAGAVSRLSCHSYTLRLTGLSWLTRLLYTTVSRSLSSVSRVSQCHRGSLLCSELQLTALCPPQPGPVTAEAGVSRRRELTQHSALSHWHNNQYRGCWARARPAITASNWPQEPVLIYVLDRRRWTGGHPEWGHGRRGRMAGPGWTQPCLWCDEAGAGSNVSKYPHS